MSDIPMISINDAKEPFKIHAIKKKKERPIRSKNIMLAYLVGLIVAKTKFNEKYRRIYLTFPLGKSYLTDLLTKYIGGRVCTKRSCRNYYLCYQIRSKKGLTELRQIAHSIRDDLPDGAVTDLCRFLDKVL